MNKSALLLIFSLALLAAIYLLLPREDLTRTTKPSVSAKFTKIDFSLPDRQGVMRRLSDWNGKPRLVNFWATWCAPCRREIPLLKAVQAAHGGDGLQVIGVAVDYPEQVEAYAEEMAFNYPVLIGEKDAIAAAASAGIEILGLPLTLVLSKEGDLLKAHMGELTAAQIDTLLSVFAQLEAGETDLASARAALRVL